ncbi:ABC transporter permease [Ostreibacterium oceani]|uniref:Arginine ABC transporter permease protein ArtM n=1 Tax=Ostreibacterium oceani TaxID=2654998 RepID=A0A6N7EW21_9GAMM|nr:ABC transporter permease [Ostreibacterium oceani]MPV86093.1 ABC transporter permease subunit [Ostreibacterium oceani]
MNWNIIIDNYDRILAGTWTTLWMVAVSLLLGLILAFATAMMSSAKNPLVRWPAELFSYIFRGTPLLIQLYIFYFGFGLLLGGIDGIRDTVWWHVIKPAWPWAIAAMTLNTAAYTCEILRGALNNTNYGEIEAAQSYGLSNWQVLRRIMLPSAFRRSLPAYGNEVIYMLHGSAVLSWVAVTDLTGIAKQLRNDYYDPYTPFIVAALIYLCITAIIVLVFKGLEKRYLAHLQR